MIQLQLFPPYSNPILRSTFPDHVPLCARATVLSQQVSCGMQLLVPIQTGRQPSVCRGGTHCASWNSGKCGDASLMMSGIDRLKLLKHSFRPFHHFPPHPSLPAPSTSPLPQSKTPASKLPLNILCVSPKT